ncbi:MAG: hypothetical protein M1409_01630 [Actinobacteria bacterium]|nr:hypothetical protein [Actinomycetota bacterium]
MEIVPSILEKNFLLLFEQIKKLSPYFHSFQIDIADGIFVPNKTLNTDEIISSINQFNDLSFKPLSFDFHLMVKNYENEINNLTKLKNIVKINKIFIHSSLFPNYQQLSIDYPYFTFALVLNPKDSVELLTNKYPLSHIASIQIMSVNPGFQGSPFLPETLKKIEQLRLSDYRNKIYLDGAINQETVPKIISQKYQPDVICPGSYLTKAENLKERVEYLENKINLISGK